MLCKINIDFREKRKKCKEKKEKQIKICVFGCIVLHFCSIKSKKSGYNQATYEHANLLSEDKRFFKTKNGASHAPPLIRLNRLD